MNCHVSSHSPSKYFGADVSSEKLKMYHPDFIRYLRNRWEIKCLPFQIVVYQIKREAECVAVGSSHTVTTGKRRSQGVVCVQVSHPPRSPVLIFSVISETTDEFMLCCLSVSDSFVLTLWKPNIGTSIVPRQELSCCWLHCTLVIR